MLAKMEAAPGSRDFTELLFAAGIEVPVRTRLEVITPTLSELHCARLRQIKETGCTVEIFLLGEQHRLYRQTYSREFRILSVQDFGNELIYQ